MAENYKISLGVDLDTSDIKTKVEALDNKYDIKLGVDLKVNDIRDKISAYNKNTNNAKLKLGIKLDTDDLKQQINKLNLNGTSSGKGVAIPINTTSLETSLKEVKSIITDIKNSLGSLDNKSGMKSLLSSINQIANALEKATSESQTLVDSLNALSKKDFSFNFNLKTGNSNPVKAMTDYGKEARRNAIPALQEQATALQNLLGGYDKADRALSNYLTKIYKLNGVNVKANLIDDMADTSSISKQMEAIEKYIGYLRKIASEKGIDLSGFDAQFSKSANEIVDDTHKIQSGAKQTEEALEAMGREFKQVFGTGINAEELSAQLNSIVADLGEIKKVINGLSSGVSIEGLTQSFNKLSEAIELLIKNCSNMKSAINDSIGGLGSSVSQSGSGLENVENNLKQVTVAADNTSDAISKSEQKIAQASTESANVVAQNEERKQQAYRDTVSEVSKQSQKIISDSAQRSIEKISSPEIGVRFKVDENASKSFEREMTNLVKQWTNNKGKLIDLKIGTTTVYDDDTQTYIEKLNKAQVTYNNELGETIQKTLSWRAISESIDLDGNTDSIEGWVEVSSRYSKSLDDTTAKTNAFVKQQKQAVSNLTNQINQLNRAANDQNAPRAIKDSGHLETLASKYNEITVAIQKMENASSDTFVDEQNNVRRLISEYKSLVSEYKNAENVSSKMKGTDFASGLKIAQNNLARFKAQVKDFPQMAQTVKSLDKAIEGVGDSASLNKFTDQLRVAKSEFTKIKAESLNVENSFNKLKSLGKEMGDIKFKIAGLDPDKNANEIAELKSQLDGLGKEYNELFAITSTKLNNNQLDELAKDAENAVNKISILETEMVDARNALAKDIKFNIELGKFDNEISGIDDKFNKLSNASIELRESIKQVKNAYHEMELAYNPSDGVVDNERLIKSQENYAIALEKTNNLLRIQTKEEKAANDAQKLADDRQIFQSKIDAWLTKNSAATKKFGASMSDLKIRAENCDRVTLNHLEKEFKKLDSAADKAGLKMESFGDRIKSKFKEYSAYFSIAEVFMYVEQGLRSMFEQVRAIDTAMTELKKVTDETNASYNNFLTNAALRAKEIGTTIDGLVESTADFARLGYGFEDAQGLAEVANIYAVVGDDIEGVEGATQSLISTMAAFKDEMNGLSDSDFALSIVDKMNEVSNNFSISSGGIGEALTRSASSLAAANNTLDESIALITAANTVVGFVPPSIVIY